MADCHGPDVAHQVGDWYDSAGLQCFQGRYGYGPLPYEYGTRGFPLGAISKNLAMVPWMMVCLTLIVFVVCAAIRFRSLPGPISDVFAGCSRALSLVFGVDQP